MISFFHKTAWLFVVTYIVGMFLPRVAVEGMFADGLCYSAIARNMAQGRGSLWEPFFSSSFWLSYNTGAIFYENLPLTFWLQSWFFKVFGDHWWTERIYCALLLFGTACLIVLVWKKIVPKYAQFAWLPLFFWYSFPTVIWASPYNQLDYTEGFFTLVAVYFLIQRPISLANVYAILGGVFTFLAVLSKGPVGLFPLAVPMVLWLAKTEGSFWPRLKETLVATLAFFVLFFVLWQYQPAKSWLLHYFDQQFLNAIAGKRETSGEGWTARLYILPQILKENAPSVVVALVFGYFVRKSHSALQTPTQEMPIYGRLTFLLIALAASLPIMISPKQHEIYLLPAFPFYAMATAAYFLPTFEIWADKVADSSKIVYWKNSLIVVLVGVFVYSGWLWGKAGREEDILTDMKRLSTIIPEKAKVGVCPNMMGDFVHHCYLQRYHKWELTTNPTQTRFLLTQSDCGNEAIQNFKNQGFEEVKLPNGRYTLYQSNRKSN